MATEEELKKIAEKLDPNKRLEIAAPKRTTMNLTNYIIEAIPRKTDMIYHVTGTRPLEEMVFQRIAYRIVWALNNIIPPTYLTNIIPVRKLNSYSVEIFGIVNHPQRNSLCSDIFKALCREFVEFDNRTIMRKIQSITH